MRSCIYDNLRKDKIKLVDSQTNEKVFEKEQNLIGERGDHVISNDKIEPFVEDEEEML